MELITLTSNENLEEFGIKTHNFTNPLLVQHNSHHLQTKPHSITLTTHTNENKQFWPMYKVMTITKIWKYSVFSEKLVNSCI